MRDEGKTPGAWEEEEEDYEPDLLTLQDDDGREHTFEVLDAADLDGVRYLAMSPWHEDASKRLEQDADMLIVRLGEDESGEEYLDLVDDEEELQRCGEMFFQRLSDVYDIDMDELNRPAKDAD